MPSLSTSTRRPAVAAPARSTVRHGQVPFITSNRPFCGRFIADAHWIGDESPSTLIDHATVDHRDPFMRAVMAVADVASTAPTEADNPAHPTD